MQEIIDIVRETLGREPEEHEVNAECARILRTARAATTNADRARSRMEAAARAYAEHGGNEKARRDIAARMGVHYHEPILRPAGTKAEAYAGRLVRVEDEYVTRNASEPMTGIVGTPMIGGLPGVEKNRDLTPYLARGFSYDAGQFSAFYRSDAIVREAVSDIVAVVSGATIEVQSHPQLTARNAELLGVDRDQLDRIADVVNTELLLGKWGGISGMIQEMLRLAMVNGAIVYEFMFDVSAPLGSRIVAISPRLPNTWMRWIQDPISGRAVALEQTNPNGEVYGYGSTLLDLSRCIHVAIDQDGDNFEGLSLLRSARAWDVLGFEVSSATILHWQRFGPGVPIVKHTGIGNSTPASRETYESLATYANLSSAVIEVGAGVDVDLLQMQMNTGFTDIMELCTRMKRASLRNSIANTGDGATGTYGWGEIKSQLWLKGLGSFVQPIEKGFNNLVRQYIDTFIGPQKVYPVLKFSNFATRSNEEGLKVAQSFAQIVRSGIYTDAELVEIAESNDVPWNGRAEEADEADVQASDEQDATAPAASTEAAAPVEPLQAGSLQVASAVLQLLTATDGTRLAPDAVVGIMVAAGFAPAAARAMVDAQLASVEPAEPAPVAEPAPATVVPEPVEERAIEGTTPPPAAQRAAAIGRRARDKAAEKWQGTIKELATSKRIAAGEPLSRLDLRTIEAYFASATEAPYPEGSVEWQEWQCMGGDAMAAWLAVELADGTPPSEDVPTMRAVPDKYAHIDFSPPKGVREAAQRALDVRADKPPSERGMTPVGIARARDLANGRNVSPDTARRMLAYFERHEVDKQGSTWDEQGKGWQAWQGWGGDAGFAWARKIVGQMNAADEGTETRAHADDCPCCLETRAAKRERIIVSGRGGGAYAALRALTDRERAVAWADIQQAKDRTSQRLNRAIEREQRRMRAEFLTLAKPLIDAGDVAGVAALSLDYTDRFRAAIDPILQSQARWSATDMRAEIREVVGRLPASVDTIPPLAASRAEAAATTLAAQVQARTIEDLRNGAVALATGATAAAVSGAGLGLGRTTAALLVQAVSTTALAARESTVAELGPEIASATYSAVMDQYTCPACEAADGTTVEYGSAEYTQLTPPNPQCASVANSGVNMCQCIWVYDFVAPPTTRSATADRTVRLYVGPPGAGKSTLAADDAVVVDRDTFVLADGKYKREGVAQSLEALREALKAGDASYVTCALSASSRQALRAAIEEMGARVECIEVTAPLEWLRLVNEDRGNRAIPWDQWEHLIEAWEPVGDGEFEEVARVVTA